MPLLGKFMGFEAAEIYDEGVAALARGDEEAAMDAFEAVLAEDVSPRVRHDATLRLGRARLALGRRMLSLGRHERAARLLDDAARALEGMPELHTMAARAWLACGDRARGRRHLAVALDSDPDHEPALALDAAVRYEAGDRAGARSVAARLGPRGVRFARADAEGRPADALAELLG